MSDIDRYINAATRDNTRRSYKSAIEHFEVQWGGFLPATADSIARYLADHAGQLSNSTLNQRLAALAQWHNGQGFPDPTKSPLVKKVMKGIQAVHPSRPQQAKPLAITQLECIDGYLVQQIDGDATHGQQLRILRNRALLLLGFWRGFRSDELSRVCVEHLELHLGIGMVLYLPHTKTKYAGTTFKVPALQRLCPVTACHAWLSASGLTQGPLFPAIDRWGNLGTEFMHPTSFIGLLRNMINNAGVADAEQFSSHSLRRGFATWANANGWDLKTTMEYIGWKDVRSAMRYIDTNPFSITSLALPS
jgi:site-specific recombinase XerD